MLAPRNALVSNLNYVHLQHVSLGVHLSLRPELMENSITKDPGKGVTGHHHLWKDIADSVEVDANSNDPSIPCQCCDKHSEHMSPCLENSEDNLEANICEELPSPFDLPSSPLSASSPSSNSSSSSDFTLDESPASMYYKEFVEDGLETPDQQPDIIPLDAAMENSLSHETNNPTILPPPSTPEESKTHSTATTTSIEKGHATTLDANCNDVSGLQPSPSPPTSGCLSCDEDAIQRTETLDNTSKSTEIQEVTHSTWPFLEDDELLPGLVLHGHVNTQSPRKTITSFNELAQKRRRGSGVGPSQQTKKDKSDWLIVFSPDSENPPQYNLSLAAGKEVTTFREMKYRSTLSKQSAQQAKFQTSGNMGPQKTACVENEFPHLSDREMWLEIPRTVENGSHHPNENGSHRQKEKEQRVLCSHTLCPRLFAPLVSLSPGLLVTIGFSVDNVIRHFNSSRNQVKKAQLGDSRLSPELGYLLLNGLCPSLYKLLADGLKPFQKDVIIGSRRLSPWNLVETSIKPGTSQMIQDAGTHTRSTSSAVSSPTAIEVFSLNPTGHYSAFYGSSAFLMLAATSQPELFDELLLILQPLSALNFHVDLLFEHHHLPLQDLPESHQLHSYGQMVSDPWGGRSLKHILHWGEQLAHNLDTPGENCSPTADSPEESTRNWWQHLSQASRIYIPSRKDSFSLAHLMNGISWGTTEPGKVEEASLPVKPESTQSRAQEEPPQIKEEGILTAQRPSSWLPPNISIFGLAKKPPPPERIPSSAADPGALCDHTSTDQDQLTFKKDDVLQLLSTVDEDWIRCRHGRDTGLVPVGYTSLIL
uniref:RUN and SH3 domain containing 1 n=1 Tax=Leptobrachium leishanense TaxID=445787 RepID=A0A8C5PIY4_9ANUR